MFSCLLLFSDIVPSEIVSVYVTWLVFQNIMLDLIFGWNYNGFQHYWPPAAAQCRTLIGTGCYGQMRPKCSLLVRHTSGGSGIGRRMILFQRTSCLWWNMEVDLWGYGMVSYLWLLGHLLKSTESWIKINEEMLNWTVLQLPSQSLFLNHFKICGLILRWPCTKGSEESWKIMYKRMVKDPQYVPQSHKTP